MFIPKFLLSIKGKLFFGVFWAFAFILFAVGLTWNTLENQKNEGKIINIAGKQRMLSQKMTKELFASLLFSGEQKTKYRNELLKTTNSLILRLII